jgi:hypothetical protein
MNGIMQSGRGAVWLARVTGGHEVAGSSPVAPIYLKYLIGNYLSIGNIAKKFYSKFYSSLFLIFPVLYSCDY